MIIKQPIIITLPPFFEHMYFCSLCGNDQVPEHETHMVWIDSNNGDIVEHSDGGIMACSECYTKVERKEITNSWWK